MKATKIDKTAGLDFSLVGARQLPFEVGSNEHLRDILERASEVYFVMSPLLEKERDPRVLRDLEAARCTLRSVMGRLKARLRERAAQHDPLSTLASLISK